MQVTQKSVRCLRSADTAAAAESEAPHSLQAHCVCSVKICFHCSYWNNNHNIMCHSFSYVSICRSEVSLSLWRTERAERDLHLLITAVCL